MARPSKLTVDYFPHIIKQGKTITILENRFGNNGYAFWFKLLEILGSTEGHSYRYENTVNKEFLYAKTHVDKETAEKILDLLAELEAIDPELWKNNIIWSDNFIENIKIVYDKRKTDVPQKPVTGEKTTPNEEFPERKPEDKGISNNIKPQSKVKESKVKNIKKDITKIYDSISKNVRPIFEDYIDVYRQKNKTKVISDTRHFGLLVELQEIFFAQKFKYNGQEYEINEEIFRAGIGVIIKKKIDNLNYAKQVWISEVEKKKVEQEKELSEKERLDEITRKELELVNRYKKAAGGYP